MDSHQEVCRCQRHDIGEKHVRTNFKPSPSAHPWRCAMKIHAQMISEALGGRRCGSGYRCRCPVHGGDSPDALAIRDGDNGILVYCFAGCEFRDIAAELRRRGLWPGASPEQRRSYAERKRQQEREHAELVLDIAAGRNELSFEDEQAVKRARQVLEVRNGNQ